MQQAGSYLLALAALVVVLGGLWAAAALFAPLACALFIIAVVAPWQRRLEAWLPRSLALALAVLAIIAVVGAYAAMAAWAIGRAGQWLVENSGTILRRYQEILDLLAAEDLQAAGMFAAPLDLGLLLGLARGLAASLQGLATFCLLMLLFVGFGLVEVTPLTVRLRSAGPDGSAARLLAYGQALSRHYRRYLLLRTAMSLATGLCVYAIAWLFALPLAAEWGVLAFVLNYLPFIGPLVATLLPCLLALVHLDSSLAAAGAMAAMVAAQMAIGNGLEPSLAGASLSMPPLLVLLAVLFWSLLWGPAGAFIGVPLAAAATQALRLHPRTAHWGGWSNPGGMAEAGPIRR
ncbi:hypothetical protein BKE38_11165 [Pseudoroseomonas deserti]|uniref:AI-2E family transporter n=1 Tax=Teichococcus deserti TaxID=1817963 RepID=A0A1V2H2X4_9PROT|nr:AI-2E family transporter [Pseudoroseomonas deserti]ONG54027.1 hypothetical protein BKE38_11165 [Pseudoroseomonas deserti]